MEKTKGFVEDPLDILLIAGNRIAIFFLASVLVSSIGLYLAKRFYWSTHELIVELYDQIEILKEKQSDPAEALNDEAAPRH